MLCTPELKGMLFLLCLSALLPLLLCGLALSLHPQSSTAQDSIGVYRASFSSSRLLYFP